MTSQTPEHQPALFRLRQRQPNPRGRPFLSADQIAIAFDQWFRREANLIANPVGG